MDPFAVSRSDQLYHHKWTESNQDRPARSAVDSPLLALARTSDVDPVRPEQVADARQVLRWRRAVVRGGDPGRRRDVCEMQRRIVGRFLEGRRAYFGDEQSRPLPDVADLARAGRDVFVVVKFMDEAPHLEATLCSLLHQEFDLSRLVVLAVDNNSSDGSGEIAQRVAATHGTAARVVYLNQDMPGAGNAARLGVDTGIATVFAMCQFDGYWERLQTATIAVSDGDTVYHPGTLSQVADVFAADPTVDGVMPFLTYKFTAALRLLRDYVPAHPGDLAARVGARDTVTRVDTDLSTVHAHAAFPRGGRRRDDGAMVLARAEGGEVVVPLAHQDGHGRRFGVLEDPAGHRAYAFEDRTLLLVEAPVAGFDAALVFLENGGVRADEKWRWHAVVGHDLFLYWSFAGMGLPERMVYPDTSDALKTFRVWSFAVGGQHQLRRPGLRIATGSDYQSGRVLQAVGCTVRLARATAFAETETDRLVKMVRNFVREQSVFYGETRSAALERATGLYVHMTRIQDDIEQELRDYDDAVFEGTVFPERVLFPLRWMLQNAVRFFAQGPRERALVRARMLDPMLSPAGRAQVEAEILTPARLRAFAETEYSAQQSVAEELAEEIVAAHYPQIMAFYCRTLRDFFAAHGVAPAHYEWLLDGLTESRNAVVAQPPPVDPAVVWAGAEFDIDHGRGQVVRMRRQAPAASAATAAAATTASESEVEQ